MGKMEVEKIKGGENKCSYWDGWRETGICLINEKMKGNNVSLTSATNFGLD